MSVVNKSGNKVVAGYDLKEYESFGESSKQFLPLRCPITLECRRAKGTRSLFQEQVSPGFQPYYFPLSKEEGYDLNPTMNTIHNDDAPKEYKTTIYHACPEVIYENYGLFADIYDKYEDFDVEGRLKASRFETEGKHYSQCAEFSEWFLSRPTSATFKINKKRKFKERDLEDYLVNNLVKLEKELEYVDRQVSLGAGRVDLEARDSKGDKVYIELKVQSMSVSGVNKICGQVACYFNSEGIDIEKTRFFVVVPRSNKSGQTYKLWLGLRHWTEIDKVSIFDFEKIYNGQYVFHRVNYSI